MNNPTPFQFAADAGWQQLADGEWFRPARLYLRRGAEPEGILKRRCDHNIIFCDRLSSGFGGPVIDRGGRICGFVFGRTKACRARSLELGE